MRLNAFYTDWECDADDWQECADMKECEDCGACMENCFTEAIKPYRFLIHGEYCLTNMNENKGDFPKWVDKSWHSSLVGCMALSAVLFCKITAFFFCFFCKPITADGFTITMAPLHL